MWRLLLRFSPNICDSCVKRFEQRQPDQLDPWLAHRSRLAARGRYTLAQVAKLCLEPTINVGFDN
jgi:hypothetical protein